MAADRRRPWHVAVALCALLAGVLSLSTPTRANDACAELHAWAVSNYADRAPSLDEVASLDRSRRAAAFGVMAPEARAALWQEHLRRFAQRGDLTSSQREVIREGMALATPALYAQDADALSTLRAFRPRVEAAFPTRELRGRWLDIGARVNVATALQPNCNCNQAEDDCWYVGGSCTGAGCNYSNPGCGFFLNAQCNGKCE